MPLPDPWWLAAAAAPVLVAFAARWLWQLCRAVQVERARELFRLQHERFEEHLLAAAAATGKPRGLAWVGCGFTGNAVVARERTGKLIALVPVEVRFEPIAGSEMEGVEAAHEPRPATAVFRFSRGEWTTDGRVVFNLDPPRAAATFGAVILDPH